ncbi:MFS transporter [Nonomuraea sp. NPDC050310]|uniref:MFS transporter n=1 Tax=unclassified Nonomuraea TaxID=2593643 RepID=UPI003408200C
MTAVMAAPVAPPETIFSPRYRAISFGLVALVTLVAFEAMAVATAMPKVADDLGGRHLYNLAFSGALAASVIATVLGGRWADLKGALTPMWSGLAAFVAGLLIAGTAPTMELFVAGRFVQGFGGGLFNVALYVLIARAYPGELHPKVFSLFSTAWVVPSLVGPLIAGVIAAELDWRLVFLGVPVLAAPAALALWRGTVRADVRGGRGEPGSGLGRQLLWAVLTAVSAALIQYGSALKLAGLPLLIGGLVLLAVALPRLLPPGTMRAAPGLPTAVILRGLAAGSMFAAEVLVPLLLIDERGMTYAGAGVVLTVGALGWAAGSWIKGKGWISHAFALRGGIAGIGIGIAIMSLVLIDGAPIALAYLAWIVTGLGIGALYPTVSILVLELSSPGEEGKNSGALGVGESVFVVVAVALTGALFTATNGLYVVGFALTFALTVLGFVLAPRFTLRRSQ